MASKILALLLALCLALTLPGCAGNKKDMSASERTEQEDDDEDLQDNTPIPVPVPAPTPTPAPAPAVDYTVQVADYSNAETQMDFTVEYIQTGLPGVDAAIMTMLDQLRDLAETTANSDLENGFDPSRECYYTSTVSWEQIPGKYLSVVNYADYDLRGAHGGEEMQVLNFDLAQDRQIFARDIFTDGSQTQLWALIQPLIDAQYGPLELYEDAGETAQEMDTYDCFTLSADGVTFNFTEYVWAPQVSLPCVTVTVPYDQIAPCLKDWALHLVGQAGTVSPGSTASPASYTPRTSEPPMPEDTSEPAYVYYFGDNFFYPSYYYGANCTWYAFGRAYEITGRRLPTTDISTLEPDAQTRMARFGRKIGVSFGNNAKYFWLDNIALGLYAYGSVPKVGSIAVWGPNPISNPTGAGHVAIVEAVNGDGTIAVSESSYGGSRFVYKPNVNPSQVYDPVGWKSKVSAEKYQVLLGYIYLLQPLS